MRDIAIFVLKDGEILPNISWLCRIYDLTLAPKLLLNAHMRRFFKMHFLLLTLPPFATAVNIVIFCLLISACGPNNNRHKTNFEDSTGGPPADIETDSVLLKTGGHREVLNDDGERMQIAYSVPTHIGLFSQIKKNIENAIDTKLSESISNILVLLYDKNNQLYNSVLEAQNQQKNPPARVEVQVSLKDTSLSKINKLVFKSELKTNTNPNGKSALSSVEDVPLFVDSSNDDSNHNNKPDFAFKADLLCHDETCQLIEIRIKKYNLAAASGDSLGQAGILYQHSQKRVHIPNAVAENPSFQSNRLNELAKHIDNNTKADVTSFAVVGGESSSHISVENLLDAHIPVLDTTNTSSRIESAEFKSDPDFKTNLIGHDQTTGDLALEVVNPASNESLLLQIENFTENNSNKTDSNNDPKPLPANPEPPPADTKPLTTTQPQPQPQPKPDLGAPNPQPSPLTPSPNPQPKPKPAPQPQPPPLTPSPNPQPMPQRPNATSIFNSPADAIALPESTRVSKGFAEYANHAEVQRMIRVLLGQEENRKTCQIGQYRRSTIESFVKYTPNIAPYLEDISAKIDVTPEIGYLLFIESNYVKSAKYLATEVGSAEDEDAGPWQITTRTARGVRENSGINFNVFTVSNRRINLNDDRSYFMNATYMAGTLLKSLFQNFESDPALAILSYNIGPGGTQKAVKKLQHYKQLQATLANIYKYNIQTNAVPCKRVNYAFTFLAARTIGQNLDLYGLEKIEPYRGVEFKNRLARPGGPLPPGLSIPKP